MNGVTGRMGMNQHLSARSCAIRAQGGVALADGDGCMPDPILVGRNAEKIEALAKAHGIERWTTDLDAALANPNDTDLLRRRRRRRCARACSTKAIAAGKHVYCEKPIATNLDEALESARLARGDGREARRRCRTSCSCPACASSTCCADAGFFGRILSVRGEFGYWVFEGDLAAGAAPVVELPHRGRRRHHPRHALPLALRARQPVRRGEVGLAASARRTSRSAVTRAAATYEATADDAAYATFELDGGVIAQHQHLLGDARATATTSSPSRSTARTAPRSPACSDCVIAAARDTPRPVWNPDVQQTIDFFDKWQEVPDNTVYDNGFKIQWEIFIRHVVEDAPYS